MILNNQKDIFVKGSRVCCIADLHVGIHQNSSVWHEISLKWADWLKVELKAKNIKDIFILGDVYHYRDEIAVNTIHTVNQILNIWKDFNIVILVGNHDAYYKDRSDVNSLSILNGKDNITVIDTPVNTTVFGKVLTFLPWGSTINDISKSDILFGHLEIISFKMNSFKICDTGLKTSEILDKANLVFSGHFHLREERVYDNGKIIYIGNPFQMDFGDMESNKGYYILDIQDCKYEFIENTVSPKHKRVSLSSLVKAGSSQVNALKNDFSGNIVKVLIDKQASPDVIDLFIKKISTFNPRMLGVDYSLYDNSIVFSEQSYDSSAVDLQKTIKEFVDILDIDNKDLVSSYCSDLYNRACNL